MYYCRNENGIKMLTKCLGYIFSSYNFYLYSSILLLQSRIHKNIKTALTNTFSEFDTNAINSGSGKNPGLLLM